MINVTKAKALFRRSLSIMIEYRIQTIIWMLVGIEPIIMMFIWMELAKNGAVGGYSASEFASYFLTAFFVRQMTVVWVVWDLDREIRLGDLSPKLLKPIDPYWEHVIENLAEKLIRFPLVVVPLAIGFWLTGASLPLTIIGILLFILALIGAWTLRFNEQYDYGLISFWTQSSTGIEGVMWAIYYVFSGAIIPIKLMPKAIADIVYLTPFPYMIDFPTQIILGKLSSQEISKGFMILTIWIVFLLVARQLLWKYGIKRYGATGA